MIEINVLEALSVNIRILKMTGELSKKGKIYFIKKKKTWVSILRPTARTAIMLLLSRGILRTLLIYLNIYNAYM